jgi:hypothetical protein
MAPKTGWLVGVGFVVLISSYVYGCGVPGAAAMDIGPLLKIIARATSMIGRGVGSEISEGRAILKFRTQYRSMRIAADLDVRTLRAGEQSLNLRLIRVGSPGSAHEFSSDLGDSGATLVSNHEVYAAIPTTEKEFRSVFGVNPSIAELGQAQAASNFLSANGVRTTRAQNVEFKRFLAESRSKLIASSDIMRMGF